MTLPWPIPTASLSVHEAINSRRSHRDYTDEAISLESLARLLWAAQGITGPNAQRSAPSAGSHYPLQVFLSSHNIRELPIGVYRYASPGHSLSRVSDHGVADALRGAALEDQPWVGTAAAIIVLAADIAAITTRFSEQPPTGRRGPRYAYIETGAASQNVHLQATALGLGCVLVAGFDDAKVHKTLNLAPELEPTAMLCVGALPG